VYQLRSGKTGQHRDAELGTYTAHTCKLQKDFLLARGPKSEKLKRVFAHVRVNLQRDIRARFAQLVERGQRNRDIVADSAHVDDDGVGVFMDQLARQLRDQSKAPQRSTDFSLFLVASADRLKFVLPGLLTASLSDFHDRCSNSSISAQSCSVTPPASAF